MAQKIRPPFVRRNLAFFLVFLLLGLLAKTHSSEGSSSDLIFVEKNQNLNVFIVDDDRFFEYRFLVFGKGAVYTINEQSDRLKKIYTLPIDRFQLDDHLDHVNYHPLKISMSDGLIYVMQAGSIKTYDLQTCITMSKNGLVDVVVPSIIIASKKSLRLYPYAKVTGFFCDFAINEETISILECNGRLSVYRLPLRRLSTPSFDKIKHYYQAIASAESEEIAKQTATPLGLSPKQRGNLWKVSKAGYTGRPFIANRYHQESFVRLQDNSPYFVKRLVTAKVVEPSAKWLISGGPAFEELDEPLIKLGRIGERHFIFGVFNYDYAYEPSLRTVDYDPFTLTALSRKKFDCGYIFGSLSPLIASRENSGVKFYFTNGRAMLAYKEKNGACLKFGNRDFFKGKGVFNFAPFHSGFKDGLLFDGDMHDFISETKTEVELDDQSKKMCRNNFRSFDVQGSEAIFSCQNVGWTEGKDLILIDKNFSREGHFNF